jgi:hypothetical protein
LIYLDTESIGFFGPTVLIQWGIDDDGVINLHNIFDHKPIDTIHLIEDIVNHSSGICGFNLVHDWFHISKTYNVLKCLPQNTLINPLDYADVENLDEAHQICLKPRTALDLLLWGKKTEFQSVLNQKDIVLKKVPKICAEQLVKELLENIKVPDIYFAKSNMGYRWQIIPLVKGKNEELTPEDESEGVESDPIFCNLRLRFNPSGSLKAIMKSLGQEITELSDLDDLDRLPNLKNIDYGWFPCNGKWTSVYPRYIHAWRTNERRLEYARSDVRYLRILYNHFNRPQSGDVDSILACAVGGIYWKGYSIDKSAARDFYKHTNAIVNSCPVNVSAPSQVKKWLREKCSPLESMVICDTKSETIGKIARDWTKSNPELAARCQQVIDVRKAKMGRQLVERILTAGRAYVVTKIIGTKSNRMAGGGEKYIKSNGSINPQGIEKGDIIRSIFTLKCEGEELSAGDFDAFEVSIAEAEYNDPGLRRDLLSGKKVHALFGAEMYNKTYEEIYATKEINKNDPHGYYSRAKTGFFGTLYGAQKNKLSKELRISVEEAEAGLERFFKKYPGIKQAQQKVINSLTCLVQRDLYGAIEWKEPQYYVESFFGFRRYFDLEFSIIHAIFNMAINPSEELRELGKGITVNRRERLQTVFGATTSALYAMAFNLMATVIRAAINHRIQSPGGQANKELQYDIWGVQPEGIGKWFVAPLNVHDEIDVPHAPEVQEVIKKVVKNKVGQLKQFIPLIKMDWKTNLKNWGEK